MVVREIKTVLGFRFCDIIAVKIVTEGGGGQYDRVRDVQHRVVGYVIQLAIGYIYTSIAVWTSVVNNAVIIRQDEVHTDVIVQVAGIVPEIISITRVNMETSFIERARVVVDSILAATVWADAAGIVRTDVVMNCVEAAIIQVDSVVAARACVVINSTISVVKQEYASLFVPACIILNFTENTIVDVDAVLVFRECIIYYVISTWNSDVDAGDVVRVANVISNSIIIWWS